MYGAIIGDIIGSRFEFDNGQRTRDFDLFNDDCCFTDDTVMTVAVAQAILKGADVCSEIGAKYLFKKYARKWGLTYKGRGYGERFGSWLESSWFKAKPYGSYGNGSAMRVSPCGWVETSLTNTSRLARLSAEITHNHPDAIKGAEATASAIFMAAGEYDTKDIRNYIEKEFGYDLSRTPDDIRPNYQFHVDCARSVPEALCCFLNANSYIDTIRNVMYIGGDTDTLGAIAGSVAEARWGIPASLIHKANEYLTEDILAVINKFYDLIGLTRYWEENT